MEAGLVSPEAGMENLLRPLPQLLGLCWQPGCSLAGGGTSPISACASLPVCLCVQISPFVRTPGITEGALP